MVYSIIYLHILYHYFFWGTIYTYIYIYIQYIYIYIIHIYIYIYIIRLRDPQKKHIFTIDSPNSGFSSWKIKNHLKQTQVYIGCSHATPPDASQRNNCAKCPVPRKRGKPSSKMEDTLWTTNIAVEIHYF